MSSPELNLKQFFSVKGDDLSQRLSRGLEPSESEFSVKASLMKEVPQMRWVETVSGVVEKFDDLLNIRITDIMVSAWNKYGVLRKYADKEKYPPNETILVPLAEHTIKSDHQPFIEILKNDRCVAKIEFTVNIVLKLEGIILKLQDGKIKEIRTGDIKGEGTVKYGGFVILNKDAGSLSLPGTIDLGEGVSIQVPSPSRIEAPTPRAAEAGALIECRICQKQAFSALTPMEVGVLDAAGVVQRSCDQCGKPTFWTYADVSRRPRDFPLSEDVGAPPRPAKPEKQVEKRKDKRLEMNLPILVLGSRGEQEVTRTENVSKGGLAVSLAMRLAVGDVLRIVCPYTPGEQKIEERTEVRHCGTLSGGGRVLYGLRYLR